MTLDELNEAKELAARRAELFQEADDVERRGAEAAHLFGHKFDLEMEDVLRMTLAGELRRRAAASDNRLRELGVVFPGDPTPGVDLGSDRTHVRPGSWDPDTRTFTVIVPVTPARGWRPGVVPGGPPMRAVDEVLSPAGLLLRGAGTPQVLDGSRPETQWRQCGTVIGSIPTDGGTGVRMQLDGYNNLMAGDVAGGRIEFVTFGYDILAEELVEREGQRPLVTVTSWRLREVLLHPTRARAEAA